MMIKEESTKNVTFMDNYLSYIIIDLKQHKLHIFVFSPLQILST